MGDVNDNLLSISQKLLKKISNRNLTSDSDSDSIMESPELPSKYTFCFGSFFFFYIFANLFSFNIGPQSREQSMSNSIDTRIFYSIFYG